MIAVEHLISIVIPVYNCKKYLAQNAQSLLNQTHRNLQIIYVDDGSTDGSSAMLDQLAAADPRICVIHKENGGVSTARNAGLDAVKGSYVTFVDADDYVEPRYAEVLLQTLLENEAQIACCNIFLHRSEDILTLNEDVPSGVWDQQEAVSNLATGHGIEPGTWAKIFPADLIRDIRYDTSIRYYEDYFFNLNVMCRASRVAFCNTHLYHYILHENSATTNAPLLKRVRDTIFVSDSAAKMPFPPDVRHILKRKKYLNYLTYYNSLLYSKDADCLAYRKELRKTILRSRSHYGQFHMGLRDRFYLFGICFLPGVYPWLYRTIKRFMPDRRTFRL